MQVLLMIARGESGDSSSAISMQGPHLIFIVLEMVLSLTDTTDRPGKRTTAAFSIYEWAYIDNKDAVESDGVLST